MCFDEKLINLVQQYPVLYAISDQHYYDTGMKESAWEEISEKLNENVDALKKRWTSLRDCFRKALNKRKTKSGQKAKAIRLWKYEDEMYFLKSHFGDRRSQKNNLQDNSTLNTDESDLENENIGEESNNISRDQLITSHEEMQTKEPSAVLSLSPAEPVTTVRAILPLSPTTSVLNVKKRPVQTTAARVLQETKYEKKNMTPSAPDHLSLFFQSMEEVVRTFSPLQQAQVKAQINSLVSKIDINNLQAPNASCHTFEYGDPATRYPSPNSDQRYAVELTDEEVRTRIKTIRTTYAAELRKVENPQIPGNSADNLYTPSCAWFADADRFLRNFVSVLPSFENSNVVSSCGSMKTEPIDVYDEELSDKDYNECFKEPPRHVSHSKHRSEASVEESNNTQSTTTQANSLTSNTPSRKRTYSEISYIEKAINRLSKIATENKITENEFDFFCKSLAVQLKNMPLDRALICLEKLQKVMTEERLHQFRVNGPSSFSSPI